MRPDGHLTSQLHREPAMHALALYHDDLTLEGGGGIMAEQGGKRLDQIFASVAFMDSEH